MPLVLPPADVSRIDVNYTYELAECTNVFHLYTPGGSTDPVDLLALLGAFVSDGVLELITNMSTALQVTTARISYSDGSAAIVVEGGFSSINGDHEADVLPASDCCVVSWLGGWSYRGGKPRTYVPGLTVDRLSSTQSLDLGFCSSQASQAIAMIAAVAAIPGSHPAYPSVALGALLGNTVSSAGTFAPYTGAVVRPQIGEQRRRNRN